MDTFPHTKDQTTRADRANIKVNDAYDRYQRDPTDENYERLYAAVQRYALSLANSVIIQEHWRFHAALNAATSSLLELGKFDPERASFSTWAHMSLKRDLIDWRRKRERRHEDSLTEADEQDYARGWYRLGWNSSWTDTFGAVENKVFLQQFLSTLSDDERRLCGYMAGGLSLEGMASRAGVSLATVKRRWEAIREKGEAARVLGRD